jgi:AmmeMemoRadiSam system protein B
MGPVLVNCKRVRTPVVSGLFYPEEGEALKARIRSWGLSGDRGRKAAALIAPHGAWDLTGDIAGAAFLAASGRGKDGSVSRVVVIGPIHNRRYPGIYLSDSAFFETPLGNIPVDQKINRELESCDPLLEVNDIPHLSEHSLEVLLPFIQFCFPDAAIVPVLIGSPRKPLTGAMGKALRRTLEKRMDKTLIVVTANLSQDFDPLRAVEQADRFVGLVKERDGEKYLAGLEKGELSACGAAAVAGLLQSGLVKDKTLTAGPRTTGITEKGETVHYGALSFE